MFFAFLLSVVTSTSPTEPHARLEWLSRETACDVTALRQAVQTRMGYDPFIEQHELVIRVEVQGLGGKLRVSRAGAVSERLFAPAPDCRALFEAMGLALAVAIDPMVLTRPSRSEPELPAPEPRELAPKVADAPTPKPPPNPPVAPRSPHLAALIATGPEFGAQPASLWGVRAAFRLSLGSVAFRLGPTVVLPSHAVFATGAVDTLLVGGDAAGCVQRWGLSLCIASRVGGLHFDGRDLDDARRGWAPAAFFGPSLSFEWPVQSAFGAYVTGELWLTLARTRLLVNASPAWEAPPVAGSLAVGVVWRDG